MKIAGITLLMFGMLISLSLGLDLIMGFGFKLSLKNAFNPFKVMEVVEIFVLGFFIFMFIVETIAIFIRKRKKKQQS